jgi:hypothetical protein
MSQIIPKNEQTIPNNGKKLPNPANYKIVKCKNFEKGINFSYYKF